jgi:hypothetical protein
MVVYESSPELSSPPFYLSLGSSYFYSLLPTCDGISFAVAFTSPPFYSSLGSSYFYSLLPTCNGIPFAVAFTSPPFYSSLGSSYFCSLLPTCDGISFAIAFSHQLHFQCLEVPTYVLNACAHACFQIPMTLTLVRC